MASESRDSIADRQQINSSKRLPLASIVCLLAGFPLVVSYWIGLAGDPAYYFTPIAFLFFVLLLKSQVNIGLASSPLRRSIATGMLVASSLMAILAGFFISLPLGYVAFLVAVTAVALLYAGTCPWTRVVSICSLLWFSWPLPFALMPRIAIQLRSSAIATASNILDVFGYLNLATDKWLDVQAARLDASLLLGADSFQTLFGIGLILIVLTRQPLLLGFLSLSIIPLVSWCGDVIFILVEVTALSSGANWLEGGALIGIKVGVFALEIGLVTATVFGIAKLLEPVPVSEAGQDRRGPHGILNRLLIWPMVLTEASGNRRSESDSYFADDEDGELAESRMVRAAPRISDVEQATDPYSTNKRLWTTTLGLACLGAILCLLAVAIPSKPSVDLATVRELDVDGSEVPEELGRLQREGFEIANASDGQVPTYNWVFSAKDGNAVLSLQPARVSQGALSNLGEWRRLGDYEENEGSLGLIQEAEYLDSLGNRSYGWFQALQSSGEQLDLNSNNRLGRTLLAKLSADGQPKPVYEVRLFLESGRILSRGRRDEYRQTFDQLMKQVQKVLQNQNGGNN